MSVNANMYKWRILLYVEDKEMLFINNIIKNIVLSSNIANIQKK